MATKRSLPTKKRILQVCVKLFLQKGYKKTTMAEIIQKTGASSSSFQNIFHAKDGVLVELTQFMFSTQFGEASKLTGENLPPVYVYAVETAIQLALTEMNENLREIYTEAYSHREASEYIYQQTAKVLYNTFAAYQPGLTEEDFFEMEIGSAGIMRNFMAYPCDEKFTIDKKLNRFLTMSLRAYKVPESEIVDVLNFVGSLDISEISKGVMKELFKALAMKYEFSVKGLIEE